MPYCTAYHELPEHAGSISALDRLGQNQIPSWAGVTEENIAFAFKLLSAERSGRGGSGGRGGRRVRAAQASAEAPLWS